MARPSLIVLFLLMIFLNSLIEVKLIVIHEVEASTALLYKSSEPQESLKDKIILSQERSIQKLNALVQDLREQLELCRDKARNGVDDTTIQLTEFLDSIGHEW